MYFYEVLLNQKIPSEVLTYKSELDIVKGSLVKVPLRNKGCFGVILGQLNDNNFDSEKTKIISETFPYIFTSDQLKLIKIIAQNTFNSINIVLDAFLQPLKLLTKKDWLILQDQFLVNNSGSDANTTNNTQQPENALNRAFTGKPQFYIEKDILVRIIYIIRSQININTQKHLFNQEVLVVFPEKKLLDKILSALKENSEFNELVSKHNLQILNFSGDVSAKSKICVKELVLTESENYNQKIIFTTRSGLFLPFKNLGQIIVIDEANTFYIQEQNSLYYDARDLAFLTASTFRAGLAFVSTLPSSRLHNFYSKESLGVSLYVSIKNLQKPLKLQLSHRNSKNDNYQLFSDQVELAITEKDTNIGYFDSPEE